MNIDEITNSLINFIGKRLPHIKINFNIGMDKISISYNSSLISLLPRSNTLVIQGGLSEIAYMMSKRLDIHFSHWNSATNKTTLVYAESRPNFTEKIELFITLLLLFPDIPVGSYFKDKKFLCILKRNEYTAKVYIAKVEELSDANIGVIIIDGKENQTESIELKDIDTITKIMDISSSEEIIKNICDKKLNEPTEELTIANANKIAIAELENKSILEV